jgi:hypothetical protein
MNKGSDYRNNDYRSYAYKGDAFTASTFFNKPEAAVKNPCLIKDSNAPRKSV